VALLIWLSAALALIALILYPFRQQWLKRRQKKYEETYIGSIESKIKQARNYQTKHEKEIQDIERNIGDLKTKLEISPDLKAPTIDETEKLIMAFRSELQLRHTKIAFYQTSIKKLQSLRQSHQMLEELASKQESLKKLQQGNYDDLADMENLKSDMEYEQFYLDSIESLSQRLLESNSLDLAQDLRLELEELTKNLGDM